MQLGPTVPFQRFARHSRGELVRCGWLAFLAAGLVSLSCSAGGGAEDNSGSDEEAADGAGFFDTERGLAAGTPLDFGGSGTTRGCNQLSVAFEARTPTALIIVDRSSSQWDGEPNHTWEPMKQGLLDVVEQVQGDMRIGVVTYTGRNGGTCPDLSPGVDEIGFALNNLDAVRTAINAVDRPDYKGETPTSAAINAALPVLLADTGPGEKFILLVTDGDPDFCDDPEKVCPMDAVVGAVQNAYSLGVSTTVFGLRRNGVDLSERHLSDVANAGAGLPVRLPDNVPNLEQFSNRCNTPAVGNYSPTSGNAEYFQANGVDQIELQSALNAIVLGIRSCVFDLAGAVEVDLDRASLATIRIDQDAPLTFGDANGWEMRSETQVELLGDACQRLKRPGTRGVDFDFPCEAFVLR